MDQSFEFEIRTNQILKAHPRILHHKHKNVFEGIMGTRGIK